MVSEEDIAEFGDLWSLMYFVFAKEMVDSFGEEGEEALRRAIRSYGRARGLRLRKRHEEQGLPINLRSLFEHYEGRGRTGPSLLPGVPPRHVAGLQARPRGGDTRDANKGRPPLQVRGDAAE
jgi:hypothetical protein